MVQKSPKKLTPETNGKAISWPCPALSQKNKISNDGMIAAKPRGAWGGDCEKHAGNNEPKPAGAREDVEAADLSNIFVG